MNLRSHAKSERSYFKDKVDNAIVKQIAPITTHSINKLHQILNRNHFKE